MRTLVTGGAGFVGSAVCRRLVELGVRVVNVDKLTYAGNPYSLEVIARHPNYAFERLDICDAAGLEALFARYQPTAVLHLAAESHVDRSINGASPFIETNVVGTYRLLETARHYLRQLPPDLRRRFRFVQVSADEVYGTSGRMAPSVRTPPTAQALPIRPAKQPPIIWRTPGTRPTASRPSTRTAPTTMGRASFPRS